MISSRNLALVSALTLALLLWLRPVVGRMGPTEGEIRAPERLRDEPPAGETSPSSAAPVPTRHLEEVASAILRATNEERRKASLPLLATEPRLAEIATAHCDDMLARGFFDHVNPDGDGPAERIAHGHRRMIGTSAENVWMGSGFSTDDEEGLAQQIVRSWMGSQGHRENILRPDLTHLGVGVSLAADEVRATQLFGRVWGYLDEVVPESLPAGSKPRLALHPYGGEPTAEQVDLFADGRPRWGPRPVHGAQLDVEPGDYLLRFYVPKPGGYLITYGPEVRITP